MVIEHAQQKDREAFADLWAQLLEHLEKLGGDIRASERTLAWYMDLFDTYVMGALPGVVLVARSEGELAGVLLWGALSPAPFDRVEESSVMGFGAFTHADYRRQGISRALRERAITDLDAMGIREVVGSAILRNAPGVESSRAVGFEATVVQGKLDVQDAAQRIASGREALHDGFYWGRRG